MRGQHHHPPNQPRTRTALHDVIDNGALSETTRKKYRLVVDQWVLFAGPDPNGWTRTRMKEFRSQLISRGMGAESIGAYLAAMRFASKWYASEFNTIDFSVIQPTRMPEREHERRKPLLPDQAERLLATCVDGRPTLFDQRDFTLLVVGLETGMRRKSLEGAMFDKIGTSRGPGGAYPSIKVPVKGRHGNQTFKVPLSDTAMLALERWQAVLDVKTGYIFRRLIRRENSEPKVTPDGLSGTSIYEMIVKRAELAKLEDVYPHILRHTFVSWRLNVPSYIIASVTGHSLKALDGVDLHGNVAKYMDPELAGEEGRKTTPPWFAQLVRRLLKEF